jgi:hypothetical protein
VESQRCVWACTPCGYNYQRVISRAHLFCPHIHRLPLPACPGWMILAIDLDQVLANYCVSSAPGARTTVPQLHTLKVCSIVRAMRFDCGRIPLPALHALPLDCAYLESSLTVLVFPSICYCRKSSCARTCWCGTS